MLLTSSKMYAMMMMILNCVTYWRVKFPMAIFPFTPLDKTSSSIQNNMEENNAASFFPLIHLHVSLVVCNWIELLWSIFHIKTSLANGSLIHFPSP